MDRNVVYKNDLAEIQSIECEILKEFIRICERYGLRYYLLEGSLLGAIRHHGMIPWDDDIDVGMFREDFERFLRIAPREIRYPYIVSNFRMRDGYKDYITQISNAESFVQTSYRKKNDVMNIWIDVFVIDGMPRSAMGHFFHKYNLLFHKMILMWSDLDHYLVSGRKNRPLYEKIAIRLCRIFHFEKFIDSITALERMDKTMKSVKITRTRNTVNFMSEYKWRTEFPLSYYGKGRMVPFGDLIVRIPEKAEEILESLYGNYMELPPEDNRYKHNMTLIRKP